MPSAADTRALVRDASWSSALEGEPLAEAASSPKRCLWLRSRPRLLRGLAVGALLCVGGCVAGYLILPQLIIQQRLTAAEVDISKCILEIGPNAAATIQPTARFSVSRQVLQLPLVSFTATVHGLNADIYFRRHSDAVDVLVGSLASSSNISIDSSKDMDVEIHGDMRIAGAGSIAQLVNEFVKQDAVTLAFTAKVDINTKVWDWLPVPFFGISVSKSLTVAAFDEFKHKNIALDHFVSAHGSPGALNVSAFAQLFNPSPVTIVLKDSFDMQAYYKYSGYEYTLGVLSIAAPLTLRPGDNLPSGQVTVKQTQQNGPALMACIADYIGPQKGFSPAGGSAQPVLLRLADGSSTSPLIEEVTRGLSVDVDLRPEPLYFLNAITADITMMSTVVPPFYKVVVHIQVTNPVPQFVYVKQINLTANHLNLEGPVLYHYNRKIEEPRYDPARYVLGPLEQKTLDFELNVLSEVSWGFLFSPSEILQLLWEAAEKDITVGINMNLTVMIADGFLQDVRYRNEALSGQLCFHATDPHQICGGLPPMSSSEPPRGSQPRANVI